MTIALEVRCRPVAAARLPNKQLKSCRWRAFPAVSHRSYACRLGQRRRVGLLRVIHARNAAEQLDQSAVVCLRFMHELGAKLAAICAKLALPDPRAATMHLRHWRRPFVLPEMRCINPATRDGCPALARRSPLRCSNVAAAAGPSEWRQAAAPIEDVEAGTFCCPLSTRTRRGWA